MASSQLNSWRHRGKHKAHLQELAKKPNYDFDKAVTEVRQELFPVLNSDQISAYRRWKRGTSEDYDALTVLDLMTLFPAAVREGQGYNNNRSNPTGKKKLWDHTKEWALANPNFKDVVEMNIKIREGITAEIQDTVAAMEKKIMGVINAQNETLKGNSKKINDLEKSVKIVRWVDRELILYPMLEPKSDWGQTVENDSVKFRQHAKDYLKGFLSPNDRKRNFIVSCGTIPEKINKDNAKYKRYRVVVRTDSLAWDILEGAAASDDHRHKIKPGKNPADRENSKQRWPYQLASMKFNYDSFKGHKQWLTRIVRTADKKGWTLTKHEWDSDLVERIRNAAEKGNFEDPKDFTDTNEVGSPGKILRDLSLWP